MEKLTKADIKGPDFFLSQMSRITETAMHYRAVIISALGAVLVVGILWAGYGTYRDHRENVAQEVLFKAQQTLKVSEEKFTKPVTPPNLDPKAAAQPPQEAAAKPTGDLNTDYKDAVSQLGDVVKNHPSTQAAVFASLDLARLYYQHQKYDEGISLLQNAAKTAKHPVTQGLVHDQLALAYEAKGDCGLAVTQWDLIQNNKDLVFLQGSTLLKMGLCYEKLKDLPKAESMYRRAENLTTDQESSKTARKYLRALKKDQTS